MTFFLHWQKQTLEIIFHLLAIVSCLTGMQYSLPHPHEMEASKIIGEFSKRNLQSERVLGNCYDETKQSRLDNTVAQ